MEYTVIVNGQSYDLPKKTMKVVEEMDKVSRIDSVKGMSIRDKYKVLYGFIKNLVGDESAKEILGSDNLEEVDLSCVTITFKKIMDAYESPLTEYNLSKSMEAINRIPSDKISKIIEMANHLPEKND